MIFSLDVRRAKKGDCLILHYGTKTAPGLILIDGGPSDVYKPQLKPRIDAIRTKRKIAKDAALPVDLLMISHVDDDHIKGILDLTKAELTAKAAKKPRLLNVLSFWHNSFDNIIGHEPKELTAAFNKQFPTAAASGGGELPDKEKEDIEAEFDADDQEVVSSTLKVLASIEQGARLRSDADALGYPLNSHFGGKLIMARADGKPVPIGNGLSFLVAGPMQPELAALHRKHQEWLEDLKADGKSPPEALAAYVDKSVPNLSSIVVLAEAGGKTMLLTGDARGDKILEGLQLTKKLAAGKSSTMKVDVLKVPHHGSANNLDTDFFERIIAKHYVFSGNGEHGNPEREAIEMLLEARDEDDEYFVHLTYPIDELDELRKEDWNKERDKQLARKKKNPNTKVREKWSSKKHSLAALLEEHPHLEDKLQIIEDDKEPHVIDLLDPLGF